MGELWFHPWAGPGMSERITQFLVRIIQLPQAGAMALITMDNQLPQRIPNTLGVAGVGSLRQALDAVTQLAASGQVVAVGLTAKPGGFCAGADLGAVGSPQPGQTLTDLAQREFRRLAALPVPTFSFINGAALGGGLELALHTNYRTCSATTLKIGFPEVRLGIIPAWGGCYLLPQLIGPAALKFIIHKPLTGTGFSTARLAFSAGIVDAVFEPAEFLADSLAWADQVLRGQLIPECAPASSPSQWAVAVADTTRFLTDRTGGDCPAANTALALIQAAPTSAAEAAYLAQRDAVTALLGTAEFAASQYAFSLSRNRKPDPTSTRIHEVGVVGAGRMGSQLAILCAHALGRPVQILEATPRLLTAGMNRITQQLTDLETRGQLTAAQRIKAQSQIHGTVAYSDLASADLVLESATEDLAIKQSVFKSLAHILRPDAIIATNTSTFTLQEISAGISNPERIIGLHFFQPVWVRQLIELITTDDTAPAVVLAAQQFADSLGKTAVLVRDCPSFVVNRMLGRLRAELGQVIDQGTPIADADQALAGLLPLTPLRLAALVGPGISLRNSQSLAKIWPQRFPLSAGFTALMSSGLTEFYAPGTHQLLPQVARFWPAQGEHRKSRGQVRAQVLAGLAEEAQLILAEKVVAGAAELDLALLTGAGFAPWNGGLTPLLTRSGLWPAHGA